MHTKIMTNHQQTPSSTKDVTGRDRLVWNTLVSWASQLLVMASGFVIPRLMHETLGQTMLGIWDLAWAVGAYLQIVSLGISSSVNRFVAKYRTEGRMEELNRFVSTVSVVQFLIACLAASLLLPINWAIGAYYADELGSNVTVAQAVVTMIGLCFAVEILFDSSRGIITGHHRWDVHNSLYAASALLGVVFMSSVLLLGGTLEHLAIAYFLSVILVEVARLFLAIKIAPDVKRKVRYFSASEAKKLFTFGAKTLLISLPQYFLRHTVNLVTVAYLGPAALAVYARPFALVQHLNTMLSKFTMILTPTASAIQSLKNEKEIHHFFIQSIKSNFAMALPAIIFFVAYGDLLVKLWMGADYQHWGLIAILSLGQLLSIGQSGCARIILGMNMHGRLAAYQVISLVVFSIVAFGAVYLFEWSLLSSALTFVLPVTAASGIVIPIYSCHALGISVTDYVRRSLLTPFFYNLPFIFGMGISRLFYEKEYVVTAGLFFILTCLIESIVYYTHFLPASIKKKVALKLGIAQAV